MAFPARARRIRTEVVGDVTVVRFIDRIILDERNITHIGEDLFALVNDEGLTKILLNFEDVTYCSSAVLGKFITLNKKLQGVSGQMIMCEVIPGIMEVFEITKLDKFFEFRKTQPESLASF